MSESRVRVPVARSTTTTACVLAMHYYRVVAVRVHQSCMRELRLLEVRCFGPSSNNNDNDDDDAADSSKEHQLIKQTGEHMNTTLWQACSPSVPAASWT